MWRKKQYRGIKSVEEEIIWRKSQYGGIKNMEKDTKWNKKQYGGKTQYGGIMEEDTIWR